MKFLSIHFWLCLFCISVSDSVSVIFLSVCLLSFSVTISVFVNRNKFFYLKWAKGRLQIDWNTYLPEVNVGSSIILDIAQIKNSKSKILRLAVHFCFLQCIYSGGHCSSWRGYRLYFRLCHSKFLFPWNHYWYAKSYTKIYDSFIEKCLLWLRHVLRLKITLLFTFYRFLEQLLQPLQLFNILLIWELMFIYQEYVEDIWVT